MKFGDRLRRERELLNWSQALLAKRLNVSPALVARIEKGDTLPSQDTVVRIAREMILDPPELFRLVEEDRKAQTRPRRDSAASALHAKGAAQLVGEELLVNRDLKEAADLLEKLLAKPDCEDLVREVLRVFAREADQEGSYTAPDTVPPVEKVPRAEKETGERIATDARLRGAYQDLKTCLSNPKVAHVVKRILQTFARSH